MADRIRAPAELADLENMVLPSRACLLAVRDTLSPAHRAALADAVQMARNLERRDSDPDRRAAAALAVLWETVGCLELAANTAAPWVDPRVESANGAWVEMTIYDPTRVNRFYQSSRNWTDERFAVLSAHRFRRGNDTTMLDVFRDEGIVDERVIAAFAEAEVATTRFLREQFQTLASAWEEMRAYAAAFEHGLMLVPAAVGEIVDSAGAVLPHAIVVWESRGEGTRGHVGDSTAAAIDAGEYAGSLAIDVAEHVADARLRVVETFEFASDGIYLRPWDRPFPYWVRRGDLTEEALDVLNQSRIAWVEAVEDA
ncbi:MAG TPA: hypothetical protein VGL78_04545 [Solirubrobacteraceae bacterium]